MTLNRTPYTLTEQIEYLTNFIETNQPHIDMARDILARLKNTHEEDARSAKISAAHKGRAKDPVHRAKLAASLTLARAVRATKRSKLAAGN